MESTPLTRLNPLKYQAARLGFWSSVFLAVLTFCTFALAVTALPKSGPSCTGDCLEYPFLDSLAYYPGDYYWMFLAMFQITVWVVWMLALHFTAPEEKKIFGFAGVGFSLMAAMVLYVDYYLQLAVVPVSLMKGETDGIALLTQYNDHGIFIALEEVGYLLMSLSLFFIALTFSRKCRLERKLKRLLTAPFILLAVSLLAFLVQFGVDRSYRFEIAAITLNWLVLIIAGIMAAVYFRQRMKNTL